MLGSRGPVEYRTRLANIVRVMWYTGLAGRNTNGFHRVYNYLCNINGLLFQKWPVVKNGKELH
jgi:hypothetical protein